MTEFAGLAEVPVATPLPGIKGVFMRDIPMEHLDRLMKIDEKQLYKTGLWMFENVLCDAEGNRFTDVKSIADVKKLGILRIKRLMDAVVQVFAEPGNV